jgi:hypothetical protein
LAPVERALPDEDEGIGEIVERGAKLFDCGKQFIGREFSLAVLDRRDGLAVLEAENAGEIVLGELAFFPQRLNPGADEGG